MAPVLNERIANLRQELKTWEKTFAASNDGRKATREEIKKNIDIASKYKEYNKLRDLSARETEITSTKPVESPPSRKQSRKYDILSKFATPSKRQKREQSKSTPRKPQECEHQQTVTPDHKRTFVGPTPHKDGRVLGLFDLITPEKDQTPTKAGIWEEKHTERAALAPMDGNLPTATPSRSNIRVVNEAEEGVSNTPSKEPGIGLTPSKRLPSSSTLATSATKRRRIEGSVISHQNTPSKPRTRTDDKTTPAFLRRNTTINLTTISEDAEDSHDVTIHNHNYARINESPSMPTRWRSNTLSGRSISVPNFSRPGFGIGNRKPFGRTLSTMIRDMREAEDEKLDDEMDVLREAEIEDSPISVPSEPKFSNEAAKGGKVLVEDSQVIQPTVGLGPDGFLEESVDVTEDTKEEETILKKRKKDPKRKTRKVALKPRMTKRVAQEPAGLSPVQETSENEKDELDHEPTRERKNVIKEPVVIINETQREVNTPWPSESDNDCISEHQEEENDNNLDQDSNYSNNNEDAEEPTKKKRKLDPSSESTRNQENDTKKGKKRKEESIEDKKEEDEGRLKKAAKKISSTAHANFRRLKINKSVKAAGRRGRFGRR